MRLILIATITLAASAAFAETTPSSRTPDATGPETRITQTAGDMQSSECNRLWEPATHMSKREWAHTCERVQGRLQEIQTIENRWLRIPKE
jgi:hypothetical protein